MADRRYNSTLCNLAFIDSEPDSLVLLAIAVFSFDDDEGEAIEEVKEGAFAGSGDSEDKVQVLELSPSILEFSPELVPVGFDHFDNSLSHLFLELLG